METWKDWKCVYIYILDIKNTQETAEDDQDGLSQFDIENQQNQGKNLHRN